MPMPWGGSPLNPAVVNNDREMAAGLQPPMPAPQAPPTDQFRFGKGMDNSPQAQAERQRRLIEALRKRGAMQPTPPGM